MKVLTVITFLLFFNSVFANEFSVFGQHELLKGKTILEIGNISVLRKADYFKSIEAMYTLNNYCLISDAGDEITNGTAMIVKSKDSPLQLAYFKSELLSTRVKFYSINIVKCDTSSEINPPIPSLPNCLGISEVECDQALAIYKDRMESWINRGGTSHKFDMSILEQYKLQMKEQNRKYQETLKRQIEIKTKIKEAEAKAKQ